MVSISTGTAGTANTACTRVFRLRSRLHSQRRVKRGHHRFEPYLSQIASDDMPKSLSFAPSSITTNAGFACWSRVLM
jgi:hypothetical protein